jgi:phytoene/squalene synthetase
MESQGLGKAFHGGEHYENFPVGSWLVPKPMRTAVLALYRFARTGDDLADEGELSVQERLAGLDALEDGLLDRHAPSGLAMTTPIRHCEEPEGRRGNPAMDRHAALAMTRAIGADLRAELDAHGVPTHPAQALLSAFRQDVHNPSLQTEHDVLDYCSRSANPIGQLVLAFAGLVDLKAQQCALIRKSNAICTGLQLANFAQDMGQDFSRGRIYVPQSWEAPPSLRGPEGPVAIHGSPRPLTQPRDDEWVTRMAHWAQEHLAQGEGLPQQIRQHPSRASLRLALEIALTLEGGKAICKKVLANPSQVWKKSPSLSKKELPMLVLRSLPTLYKKTLASRT